MSQYIKYFESFSNINKWKILGFSIDYECHVCLKEYRVFGNYVVNIICPRIFESPPFTLELYVAIVLAAESIDLRGNLLLDLHNHLMGFNQSGYVLIVEILVKTGPQNLLWQKSDYQGGTARSKKSGSVEHVIGQYL